MRFKQYQAGGAIYTPVVLSPQAVQQQPNNGSSKTEKADNKIRDEIISVLKENGLQNDVDQFLEKANAFLSQSQALSNAYLFGGNDDYSLLDLTTILSMANKVKENKLQYNTAVDRLKTEDAWHEVAVSSTGHLYVYDKEKKGLSTISASDYNDNRDKYDLLTNTQVMGLRENDSNLAYNSDILKNISGATGLKTVTDQLLDTVTKFGNVSWQEYVRNTGAPVSKSAYNGMQILIGEGPDGYYKATTKTELKDVENALDYLWSIIGVKGRARLSAEAVLEGKKPEEARLLILQMLNNHTDHSKEIAFDSAATKTLDVDTGGEGSGALGDDPRESRIARGDGVPRDVMIAPRVDKPNDKQSAITAKGINFGQLLDKNGDMLEGYMSLREVLKTDPVFGAQTDAKNVTFGNIHLSARDLDQIVVDTNFNNLSGIYLPYKEDGAGVVPDFSMVDAYKRVEEKLKKTNDPLVVKEILRSEGIDPSKVDRVDLGNGNVGYVLKTKYFLTFSAYGNDDTTLRNVKDKRYFEHIGEEGSTWLRGDAKRKFDPDLFNETTMYGKSHHTKNAPKIVSRSMWTNDDWDYDNAYMGNVFVAVDPLTSTYSVDNQLVAKNKLTNQVQRIQVAQNAQNPTYKGNFD